MTIENKQIRCQEKNGSLSYALGRITLWCRADGHIVIKFDGRDYIFGADDAEDLISLFVGHNQLLVDMGGGIRQVHHHMPIDEPTPVMPKASTRTDN